MYVKTMFLNSDLEEEIYMKQQEGFLEAVNEGKVGKLVESLYVLKQSPKQWHEKFDSVILSNGSNIIMLINVSIQNLLIDMVSLYVYMWMIYSYLALIWKALMKQKII